MSERTAFIKYISEQYDKFRAKSKRPALSSFKSYGNRWLGEWSNNCGDRDEEWFSAKSMRDYESRVDFGLTPLPELWVWHGGKAVSIGKSDMVFTVEKNGVLLFAATGEYADTPRAQMAKEYYNTTNEKLGMSHGFTYPQEGKKGRVYNQFNTFELSVLPLEYAANPYTAFNSKEFQMNEKKLEHLKAIFGEAEAAKIVQELESKAKDLSEIAEYKEFFSISDATATEDKKEHNHADSEVETALKAIVSDVIPEMGELTSGQLGIMKKVKEQSGTIESLQKSIKAMQAQIKEMDAALKAKPKAASEADETMMDDEDDPEAAALKKKFQDKEAGEKDSFWNWATEKERK